MMKRKRKNRIIIAWVLLMTLMPISIVKATHHHDIEEVASSQSTDPGQKNSGNDYDSCPICHFLLSPFIESQSFHFFYSAQLIFVFIAQPCPGKKKTSLLSATLRAPPSLSLS